MTVLLSTVIVVLAMYLIYSVLHSVVDLSIYKHTRLDHIKQVHKEKQKRVNTRNKVIKNVDILYNFFSSLYMFRISDSVESKLKYYSTRLNMTYKGVHLGPKFIYILKCSVASMYVILIALMSLTDIKLVVLIVFYRVMFELPDWVFDFIITKKNSEIEEEFVDFYSEFYYPLIHKHNRNLALKDLALRYRPMAGPEMVRLIDNFRADCAESEHKALANLKHNYKIADVHKFVDRMSFVINGQGDAVQVMEKFKDELDHRRRMKMIAQKEKSMDKAKRIELLIFALLGEVVLIYAGYNVITSISSTFRR